ncbi:MAG: prepilin-type N-terminal cleavage/methylation domain-containing protein [Verrucomicrobiae bacterium]|nr:prepilin-type N-terminal cleavage/methylation domain-containing protein [Verrucomicrobiae bacterium]
MHPEPSSPRAFTLFELLMAMALFTMAAVSLAEALNLISLTVSESIDDAEVRESLRATLLEVTRDTALTAETRETNPDEQGLYFRIEVDRVDLKNEDGQTLDNLFEVKVTALRQVRAGRDEVLDSATTLANPNLL